MMKKNKKIVFILIITFVTGLALLSFLWPRDLKVSFLDVGQGDAILIQTPSGINILIDGGPDFGILEELGRQLPWWDRQIDLMVLSHAHDDHVGGLYYVLNKYKVKQILYNGLEPDSYMMKRWLEQIDSKQLSLQVVNSRFKLDLGPGLSLNFLYPDHDLRQAYIENENNSSIILKLDYDGHGVLLAGDAEVEIERYLLGSGLDISADILKLSHHGSDNANGEDFLGAVSPKFVVVQVGSGNRFGHPSLRVTRRVERVLGREVLRTDLLGAISFRADSEGFFVE